MANDGYYRSIGDDRSGEDEPNIDQSMIKNEYRVFIRKLYEILIGDKLRENLNYRLNGIIINEKGELEIYFEAESFCPAADECACSPSFFVPGRPSCGFGNG